MLPVDVGNADYVERTASANRQAPDADAGLFAYRHICAHHIAKL
jgi:hypothetical protein